MRRRPAPTKDDLALLDPDGAFRDRLLADRAAILPLADAGRIDELAPLVHRLAGAAGTFGYAGIGDAAIELDEALRDGRSGTAPLLAALRQALEAL